jgi:hypothetical protein
MSGQVSIRLKAGNLFSLAISCFVPKARFPESRFLPHAAQATSYKRFLSSCPQFFVFIAK